MAILARRNPFDIFDWTPEMFTNDWETAQMRVEEFIEGNNMIVKVEIPGIDPDKDVEITVTDGRLRIQAERKEETEQRNKEGYRSEIRYGSFIRDIPMPLGAKKDKIKATYKDGVLRVMVPMSKEGETSSKIAITKA